jgi:hypothetical protein
MKTPEPTIANADIWAKYYRDQWGAAPGSPAAQIAEGTAARVANFLTMVALGPIALLSGSTYAPVRSVTTAERQAEEAAAHAEDLLDTVEDHAA